MKAADVKAALRRRHGAETDSGEWVVVEEAFCGWTSGGGGIDLLAVGAWATAKAPGLPGAGRINAERRSPPRVLDGDGTVEEYVPPRDEDARHPIVAYEVKVSRADLRRELYGYRKGPNASYKTRNVPAWPGKAHLALSVAHYFMLAVPRGLLTAEEEAQRGPWPADWLAAHDARPLWVPEEAGLLEVDSGGCRVVVPAPRRVPRPIERGEMAELLRHAVKPNVLRKLRTENAALRRDNERLLREQHESHQRELLRGDG